MFMRRVVLAAALAVAVMFASLPAQEQARVGPSLFAEMTWRSIGPHRASRTVAVAGHRRQPFTFYMAAVNGGVWKTTDAGTHVGADLRRSAHRVHRLDRGRALRSRTSSTSAAARACTGPTCRRATASTSPPTPGGRGPGSASTTRSRFRASTSTRATRIASSWRRSATRTGPTRSAAIFRSLDGGRTFQKVLYKDENTGGNDVDIDPIDPNVVYATLWEERQGPWENAVWAGTGGGIFKSTDGGTTWKPLTKGLPPVVQANLAISPADRRRLYAAVAFAEQPGSSGSRGTTGIFRSDDAGQSWTRITTDTRPSGRIGGGDLPVPIPHPKLVDTVIMVATVSWKTTDGGKTWAVYKGAPGGEDYQNGWINPDNPDIILLAADQGAVVTLNGGETWSSWYNQSTAQLYHAAADNAFPYRVCSGQQESGSACVASRGNYGAISNRDWLPVGVDEYGYVAPDPLNPDIVYGGRNVSRFDRRTGQVSSVGPVGGRGGGGGSATPGPVRSVRTMPVVFSEVDKVSLFFANNYLWKTMDGGVHWSRISPDLTRADVGDAVERRQVPRGSGRQTTAARRHLHDCTVLPGHQAHLGRHRRRAHPRHRRRRAHLEGRDATRRRAVGQDLSDRRRAIQHEHRLRCRQHAPPRRHAAAHLPHARRRRHVDRDRDRHPERRDRERRAGGPAAQGAALCRDRARRLRVVRRRRPLAAAAAQHGRLVRERPDRQRRRPRGRYPRPGVLDPRRHHAAQADRCGVGGEGRDPLRADHGMAGTVEHEHRHAVAQGGTNGGQPA